MINTTVIKTRKKRHAIWNVNLGELIDIVQNSISFNQILTHFNIDNKSASYRALKDRLNNENISFEHINRKGINRGNKFSWKSKFPLSTILVENSSYARKALKKRLIEDSLLKEMCNICKLIPEWNGKKLSLQLDHINGIANDNRLENLRLLCPNCHSQTDTFGGKKCKKARITNINNRKVDKLKLRKVERPSKEILEKMLWQKSTLQIAKEFGISDKAVEKWAKRYNLSKPPRGYWRKQECTK